jgi:hypothetical protein
MKRLLLAAAFAAGTPLAAHAAESDSWQPFSATLEPGQMHEECLRVEKGEKRRYLWKSSAPVDFNIHYHKEPEVFYPVKRDGMRGDGGTFIAKTGEDYCWMWTARDKPAKLEGRVEAK